MKITGLVSLCLIALSFTQEQAILELEVTQIRSDRGVLLLSVYSAPDEYPYHPFRTIPLEKDSLKESGLRKVITDLLPGTYVFGLLDDENRSGTMEYTRLGIPLEGFGFSNNPKILFSRPDYERCQFTLKPGINRLQINTRYKH